jgi:hypothetical protein
LFVRRIIFVLTVTAVFFFTFLAVGFYFTWLNGGFHEVSSGGRRLAESTVTSCTWKEKLVITGAGAAAGGAIVLGTFAAIGLSPFGPVAGGLFAANMGAAVQAGSVMATVQSAAMTGTAYGVGAAVTAVGTAATACGF